MNAIEEIKSLRDVFVSLEEFVSDLSPEKFALLKNTLIAQIERSIKYIDKYLLLEESHENVIN